MKRSLLISALAAACSLSLAPGFSSRAETLTGDALLEVNRALPITSNQTENWPTGPVVGAEAAILIEAETGTILYEKNIHQKEYPASTTKILTTLMAAETCDLDDIVSFSHDAIFDTPRTAAILPWMWDRSLP